MVLCNHGAPDGEDEATGREAGGYVAALPGAPRTGSAERARAKALFFALP